MYLGFEQEPDSNKICTYEMVDPFMSADIAILQLHAPEFTSEVLSNIKVPQTPKAPKLRPQASSMRLPLQRLIELPQPLLQTTRKLSEFEVNQQSDGSQCSTSTAQSRTQTAFWQIQNLSSLIQQNSAQKENQQGIKASLHSDEIAFDMSLEKTYNLLPQNVLQSFLEQTQV